MSVLHRGKSWRSLVQLRQSHRTNPPSQQPFCYPKSTHLGLQQFRTQNSPLPQNGFVMALHGSVFCLSSPCLHHFSSSPSFSTAAEAANTANFAAEQDSEGSASVQSAEMGMERPVTAHIDFMRKLGDSTPVAAMAPELATEKMTMKMLEELVNSLQAELEDQKTLIRSILNEISLLKSQLEKKTAEEKLPAKLQWPEWTTFLEHLKSFDFFKDEERKSPEGGSVFDDPTCVKRAIFKFSQAHESVYESLSQKDLQIIAQYGCATKDQRAAASQKRLLKHFQLEEDTASDSSAVKPAVVQPKLSDVTRLLYSTVTTSQEDALSDDVKSSILHVLREIVTLSGKPIASLSPAPSDTKESSKQEKGKLSKTEKAAEARKANLGKREEGAKTPGKVEAGPEAVSRPQQWKCPRCFFMNLNHNQRCVECSRRRPGCASDKSNTEVETTEKHADTASSVDGNLDVKAPVDERKARKARERLKEQKDNLQTPSTQEQKSEDVQSSSEADTSSEGSGSGEHFDILDDILESEDSDDDQQDKGRRAPLSDLFANKTSSLPPKRRDGHGGMDQRNDFGREGGRRPPKGKRYEDEAEDPRPRRGYRGDDEGEGSQEDDDPPPRRSGRALNNRDDEDPQRRSARGGYNSFRGGGYSRGYGGGGARGDSYDDRRRDGGWKGGRPYGDRNDQQEDRGSRSGDYGGRISRGRGRPRY